MQSLRTLLAAGIAALTLTGLASAQLSGLQPHSGEKRLIAKGRKYALIVGVGEAKPPGYHLEPLPGCIDDAHAVDKALKGSGYQTTVLTEKDAQAPKLANVTSNLKRICSGAADDDQIIVYFSTHGGAPGGVPALAMKDDLLPLRAIKAELAKSKAAVRIILLDACRDQDGFPTETSEFRDIHTILSCRPDEKSTFGPSGLSAFTEVLVEGLTDCKADRYKDGHLDLDEVLIYLDENVPDRALRGHPSQKQNPTRTVVDPRALNPILSTCSAPVAANEPVAVAVVAPVLSGSRNDLVIPAELVGRLTIGMPARQFLAGAGSKARPFTLNQTGRGSAVVMDIPDPGDEVHVEFVNGMISKVQKLHPVVCQGEPDLDRTRLGWELWTHNAADKDLTKVFGGMTPDKLFEALGCPPSGTLKLDTTGAGEVVYKDVPNDGNHVTFTFERGNVSYVSLTRVYCTEKNHDAARARLFLARVSEGAHDNELSDKLRGMTMTQITDGMGCPTGGPLLMDESGKGSAVYPNFPMPGDITTFNFRDSKVIGVFIDRAVLCINGKFNVEAARKGFASLAEGQNDNHVNDAVRGKTPEELNKILGCPSAPTRLDGNGMGYAVYDNIPEDGDKFTILFHKRQAIGAQIDRRVK